MTTNAQRAQTAAVAVGDFTHRVWKLPGTRLARAVYPPHPTANKAWNYWWQAHLLDAIVDAGERQLAEGNLRQARRWHRQGRHLLVGLWLRNKASWTNDYYDDMAWLALANLRWQELGRNINRRRSLLVSSSQRAFTRQFQVSMSCPWGGCWWHHEHDFANAPATAPIGLWCARTGKENHGLRLLTWLLATLRDPNTGLIRDGFREIAGNPVIEETIWTYNQGTTLGLLLALGETEEAERLITTISEHLCVSGDVLRTDGSGDAGLFTGILVRYLGLAAQDQRLSDAARSRAAAMVFATSDALWEGRSQRDLPETGIPSCLVFPIDVVSPAAEHCQTTSIELTPQLQAWTVFETAAALERATADKQL
ncbi:MAG: glycoside hydrolase family 76 protein [Propionibacteriaceae bacterium]